MFDARNANVNANIPLGRKVFKACSQLKGYAENSGDRRSGASSKFGMEATLGEWCTSFFHRN